MVFEAMNSITVRYLLALTHVLSADLAGLRSFEGGGACADGALGLR